jgi:excisionase family DNA binding protein
MMDTNTTDKLLLTVPEASRKASVCTATGYEMAASGRWPVVRIGRSVRIPLAGLQKWIEENTSQVAAA